MSLSLLQLQKWKNKPQQKLFPLQTQQYKNINIHEFIIQPIFKENWMLMLRQGVETNKKYWPCCPVSPGKPGGPASPSGPGGPAEPVLPRLPGKPGPPLGPATGVFTSMLIKVHTNIYTHIPPIIFLF